MSSAAERAFQQLPDRVKRCVWSSLRLQTSPTSQESLRLGQSRLGGQPDLPPHFVWPRYGGLPLSFIAQIDLSELASQPDILPLPTQGSLVFFYDSEQRTWGYDPADRGSAVVAFLSDPAPSLIRAEFPADLPVGGRFNCCDLRYSLDHNLPDPWSVIYQPSLSEEERTLVQDYQDLMRDESIAPLHRLGGHADCVQNPMELECQLVTNGIYCGGPTAKEDPRCQLLARGAPDWRLLLQIDTDDHASIMWGDGGKIYYWIRAEDMLTGDFDKSWLILQCY